MGGNIPLGYDVKERKLVVNEVEAETVRLIFRRYADLGSVRLLRAELDRRGIVSKRREGVRGQLGGGYKFSRGALYTLLQNRLYRGEIAHHDNIYPGQHDAIVDAELWDIVKAKLVTNRHERSLAVGAEEPSLLSGLIVDENGNRMSPTHAVKKGKRYRYYISARLVTGIRSEQLKGRRIPAGDIEGLVQDRLRAFFASEADVADGLATLDLDASTQRLVLQRSAHLAVRWRTIASVEIRELVRSVIEAVSVEDARIVLRLNRQAVASRLVPDASSMVASGVSEAEPIVLSIDATLRRAGKGVRLVLGDGTANTVEGGLVKMINEAFAIRRKLLSGSDTTIDAMAQRAGVKRDYLSSLFRLSYLSPKIVRAILAGHQPVELSPKRLMMLGKDLPHDWQEQRLFLGFTSP